LTSAQKDKVKSFASFTHESDSKSTDYLKRFGWNLEVALDEYYNKPHVTEPKVDEGAILAMFKKYAGTGPAMTDDGITKFFTDIGVSLDDVITLIISWHLKATEIGKFTQQEFVTGFKQLGCATIEDIKKKIPQLKTDLKDDKKFKEFYLFVFDYAKGPSEKKKVLELDFAVAMWQTVLPDRFKHLNEWIKFLQERHKKPITKDTWSLLWEFSKTNITGYDASEAWPVLIDDFVDYINSQTQQ